MKKRLFFLLCLGMSTLALADNVILLDSVVTRDPYDELLKRERYTYNEAGLTVKKVGWDNTGSYLKQDSTLYRYDEHNRLIYQEANSYPRTSKYPGWKGSSIKEYTWYDNGWLHTEKNQTFNQPSDGSDGYYYYSSGSTYTYFDDGRKKTYIMASGTYNTEFRDKVMYIYNYDDTKRLVSEDWMKQDDSGQWTKKDSRRSYTYDSRFPDLQTQYQYDEYNADADSWTPKTRYDAAFNHAGKQTLEAYWSYDTGLSDWYGTSKTETTYLENGTTTDHFESYTWDQNTAGWTISAKGEYQSDNQGRTVLYQRYNWKNGAWSQESENEYGYDDQGRENMSAYYSFSSGTKKGSTKTIRTYDDLDRETERLTYAWNTYTNSDWMENKKKTTQYNPDGSIALETEELHNGWFYEPNSTTTYYYHTLGVGIEPVKADAPATIAVAVSKGSLKVLAAAGLPVRLYTLQGTLVGDRESYDNLAAGVYVVTLGSQSVKVLVP